MAQPSFKYLIIGGGLAGANAAQGIRELDEAGSIAIIGSEKYPPYDRPPLTKKLWFGKKKVEDILLHPADYYPANGIELLTGLTITGINMQDKTVTDHRGNEYKYEKLLLATGGAPRTMNVPGGELEGLCYYRYLDDYLRLRQLASKGKTAVVVGGGFIGSEIAAALNINQVEVTLVQQDDYLVARVFPEGLGRAVQQHYLDRGVKIISRDSAAAFEKRKGRFVTTTRSGQQLESDLLVVGIGLVPSTDLAEQAGLTLENGIAVNEFLQTSHPDIYAGGDNAFFPYLALGKKMRIEHWDNAINQGRHAGRNMAGAGEPFTYMPYFFSDLFEFGYEAVGEVSSRLETFADWQKENDTGVIYYLEEGKVRGAMMCNVWDKVPAAREIIRPGKPLSPDDLRGAIQ